MKLVFTSYASSPEFTDPGLWLQRIRGYTGILEELGSRHTVIGIERINFEGEYKQNGVHYYFTKFGKKTPRFPHKMHRLIADIEPEVVFVNGFIFPFQLLQLRMKLGKRVKIILVNRSERPAAGWRKQLQRWADKYVDAYLFPSAEQGKRWVTNGTISTENKIHEVMHGSSVFQPGDQHYYREALGINGAPVFLWVGRLDANKDPVLLVKAFKKYLARVPAASLYMIYQQEELLKDVSIAVDGDLRIHLLGKKVHTELRSWYSAADFIISTSHYEGGGIAVCEAMSCGCVPVLSNIESFRALTAGGNCGFLFQPGDEDDLFTTLLVAGSSNLHAEREKTINIFEKNLSFPAIAQKIEEVIHRIV